VNEKLLLDEHYAEAIAARVRAAGHDVLAMVADPELCAQSDLAVFRRAAASGRRIVTENVKDFRPLLQQAYAGGDRWPGSFSCRRVAFLVGRAGGRARSSLR
jgi:hypothetical protein